MTRHLFYQVIATVLITAASGVLCQTVSAQVTQQDTTKQQKPASDSLRFPISDRRGDPFSSPDKNPFNLKDPINLKDSIEYDPITKQYYIVEKIGNQYFRKPTYLTFDELMRLQAQQSEDEYFRERADALAALNKKMLRPNLSVTDNLFNRIFGNAKPDIRPSGNVDIIAGYQGQNIQNPTLPESARKTGGFDFNMDAALSVIGNIGQKLKLPITYNTQANFNFENQLKLDYTGSADEIVKKIEAGNISFTTKSTLITGAQALFGVKAQLQFGRLSVTAVLANQSSQKQSVNSAGGASVTNYSFQADDYEENRHFLLAQYFRNNYNNAMKNLPVVNSQVQILKIEVWVTNRNGTVTGARDIVGLMDLGEAAPYNPVLHGQATVPYPYNNANNEYTAIINNPNSRSSSQSIAALNAAGLVQVTDFEQVYARQLAPTDFYFNPKIGFISVNAQLQSDDVLAAAYQYSYNGVIYQVGEFAEDVPPDTTSGAASGTQKVLFLKLLKATAQRTNLPIWNLMMKNVYALKTATGSVLSNIQSTGFQFNVSYNQPSRGTKRYLPEGPKAGVPLLTILNLDRLNAHNDPGPDGIFDYIEGYTVISSMGKVIFPVLEPFGKDLDTLAFPGSPQTLKNQYVFYQLYDTIKEVAKTFANVDRYVLSGTAKGQASSSLSLGAFNVPQGSVVVTAGGQTLKENVDYIVDYNLGTVQVINQSIINSGIAVNVSFENNAQFGAQQRSFMALRLDYLAKSTATQSLTIGSTIEKLSERPFFSKTSVGEDPINNTMYGVDVNYRSQEPGLTRALNKLPFYTTKEMSTISAYGEAALLKPGHPAQIGKGTAGAVYIDDFEGSTSSIDLRFPLVSWALASTPQGNGLFPEGSLNDSLPYGYNRAKIAWYNIDPTLQDQTNSSNPVAYQNTLADPRVAPITTQNLFPQQTVQTGQAQLITFDLAYYPGQRGPYNFDTRPGSISNTGALNNPQTRWGGIMRAIDQTDFETNNIEVIQFWMQDPFLTNPTSNGGQLYLDLGYISEDILKDGRKLYENGLNTPNIQAAIDSSSVWGNVPENAIQITNAFSNNAADRPYQDVGFDGLDDNGERRRFQNYLNKLAAVYGTGSQVYQNAYNDPSSDNFTNYRDASYDNAKTDVLGRYKNVNNPQGNSPIATTGSTTLTAFTLYPDQEDLNHDNTMNELESYFEYKVNLKPNQVVGSNFITDEIQFTPSGSGAAAQTWYQFSIPIASYNQKIGDIPDFKSIQFIRMFLTNFTDTAVVCRFAQFQLVRNTWRNFNYVIDTTGNYTVLPTSSITSFNVTAVNIEQNSTRTPIIYIIPPGVARQQELGTNNTTLLLNEQSMSLQICNLANGDVRGVYKTTSLDLRQYGNMDMFIHAEAAGGSDNNLNDNDLSAIIRLGSDFVSNYYEIRIPLKKTHWHATLDTDIWPAVNDLNLTLSRLITLKTDRNNKGSSGTYYKEVDTTGRTYAILGNPNLGQVTAFFLGVENVNLPSACTEVWFDELRLSDLNDHSAWATTGRVDVKLADLGMAYVSGSYKSAGWGTIDQNITERSLESDAQVDVATNLELGKLLPKKAGMTIPVYASVTKTSSTPEYDPYDLDIKLSDKIKAAPASERDSIRAEAIDATVVKTVNFTNVGKLNTTGKKPKIWNIENFNVSYSYTSSEHHSPLAVEDELITHKGSLSYNYANAPKYKEPFKKWIKSKSPWWALIRDFNVNLMPNVLSFRADIDRQFGAYRSRNVGGPLDSLPETYNKFFTFNRTYTLHWDFTRSLFLDYTAINQAWVDEDSGRLNKQGRRKMWDNFFKGGRNINYAQTVNFGYTLPTNKLPLLDWTTIKAGYSASYTWTGASLLAPTLGNSIQNTLTRTGLGEFDFTKLYGKWRILRALDQSAASAGPGRSAAAPGGRNRQDSTKRLPPPPPSPQLSGPLKALAKLLTSLKRVTVNYTDNSASTIFGFLDSTRVLGMDLHSRQPGWGYTLGQRPDTNFINRLGRKGLLSTDTNFNNQNLISYTQKISIRAQFQPVRDLNIDINWDKTYGKNYSELYKDTANGTGLSRLNPYMAGSFTVSFISFQTLFKKYQPDEISSTFQKFENYRQVISLRLGNINPYTGGLVGSNGYAIGYGKYAQDVIIPAFIAAYTGKSPSSIALINDNGGSVSSNPFSGYLPKPNWSLTYKGLAKLAPFNKIFTSFIISNGYTSSLSMNSFNSQLNYADPSRYGQPGFIDTLTGNYVPYFQVPNVTITEQFSPLINIDMQFVNQLQAKFTINKSRQLSLSLLDFQLSETHSTQLVIGAGWKLKNVPLPFHIKMAAPVQKDPKKPSTQNDLTIRLDFGIMQQATSSSYLDQGSSIPTAGQTVINIDPSLDYVLNNRLNLKLYFDQTRTTPTVSTSPPTVTTKVGLQVRISLAP